MPADTLPDSSDRTRRFLLRLPEVFAPESAEMLAAAGARGITPLSGAWRLATLTEASPDAAALFIPWRLPVEHSWPCHPEKTENFIERAAQALAAKFAPRQPQAVLAGPLSTGPQQRYYKSLASNLRGRLLQLFPKLPAATATDQHPRQLSLYCMVGKEGLFAGMTTPREAGGFHPGGLTFIRQAGGEMISRAGAKISEALQWLRLATDPPAPGAHWLELGASPGGMTGELLRHGYTVTAVDRAPLDARLHRAPGLRFYQQDAAEFRPPAASRYDALLCDLNGDALHSLHTLLRFASYLRPGGLALFTLKTPGCESPAAILQLFRAAADEAAAAGLTLAARAHLTHNRREFTLLWVKAAPMSAASA